MDCIHFSLLLIFLLLLISPSYEEETLVFVYTHFRHGARGTSSSIDKDGIDFFGEAWIAPDDLTGVGLRMHYALGLRNRKKYLSFFEEYFFLNDKHKKICSKIKKETETSFECQIDEITFLKNVNFVFDNRIALFIYKEDLFDCDIKTNKCIFLSQLGKILINLYLVYLYFNNFTLYSIITQSIFSSMEAQTRQKLKLKEKKLLSSQKSSCIYVYSQ